MYKVWLTVFVVLSISAAAFFAACGGDGDETIDTGDGEITISDDLPDDFPDDFPIYDGADLQGSYRGEREGIEGLVATWTTGDSAEDVSAFYEEELNGDNWTIQSQGDQGALGSFFVALNNDESKAAYVYIGSNDDDTTIVVTVGDNEGSLTGGGDGTPADGGDDSGDDSGDSGDDGSSDGASGSADLPDEQDLPDDFPSDRVPLPSGARVTSNSSISSGGTNTFFVEFYSEQSADELSDYFKDELPNNGWTESLSSQSGGEVFLSFAPEGGETTSGVTIIIADAPTDGYRLVTLSIFGD
ncbi:MAG: hypothetical protein WD359_00655 [Dehalococcoidia bacterium]